MNDLVIKNDEGNAICKVSYNEITGNIDIVLNRPINLQINGDLGAEINGECDLTVHGDMRIDTFLAKLFINSYISKYIKDNPEAIEQKIKFDKRNKSYNEWMEINRNKMIDHAEKFIQLKKET
jgi:hypothetical protein